MPDTKLQNKITALEARWKKLKSDQLKGILSTENQRLESNQINDGLLILLETQDQPKIVATTVPAEKVPPQKTSWKTILMVVTTTIGVLAGIAEITGYSVKDWLESKAPSKNTPKKDPIDTDTTTNMSSAPPQPVQSPPPSDTPKIQPTPKVVPVSYTHLTLPTKRIV